MANKNFHFNFLFCLLFIFANASLTAQSNQWVWLKGSNTPNSLGNYGTQGIASPSNAPPARYEPSEWTDNQGNFWMYGGYENVNMSNYSDLWKYNPTTNMWTWMNGPNTSNNAPVYGTQGIPSPLNNPGPRKYAAASWTDASGNLWLFGGFSPFSSMMNDLWKYDIASNQWTWMKGPSSPAAGVYGTMGIETATNNPNYRSECSATWTDNAGMLWMFGGEGNGLYNDLWRYNPSTNNWTWMSGSQWSFGAGNWGTQGVGSVANIPSARRVYTSWKDVAGDLWLFGGNDSSFFTGGGSRNDLWKYEISTGAWTWVSGSNVINDPGTYGTQCTPSVNNKPSARMETRTRWTDDCGNFWLFGGASNPWANFTCNDLWKYTPASNEWTWVSGSSSPNQTAVYGTQNIPAPANRPGARMGCVGWKGKDALYLLAACLLIQQIFIMIYGNIFLQNQLQLLLLILLQVVLL